MKNHRIQIDNNENHGSIWIPLQINLIMKIIEFHMRIMKIMKILEFHMRNMKIMKIIELQLRIKIILKINKF